jgi:glycosyltransferase involved in cell wall biosynthesis
MTSDVSVIVPVRDGERYLPEALESIVEQTLAPAEVIVVDDGSTDGTSGVAARFGPPVRCLRVAPAGVAAAVNRGVGAARGSLIALLDADDIWTRGKLGLQVAALERDRALDVVFGHVEHFVSPELAEAQRASIRVPPEPLAGYSRGTMLARREAMERVGPFDSRWRVGEFVDWWARAVEAGLCAEMLPEVVMRRRLHGGNMGVRKRDDRADFARVVREALDRRRAAPREGAG